MKNNLCSCKEDFNLAAKIFLVYFIIKQISGIIGAVSNFRVNEYLGGITGCYIATIIVNSALIISALFAFKPRKYALISIIVFLLIKTLAIFPYGNGHASGMAFGRNVGYLIVDFAPFAIALCFKKNGISGWRAFFSKRKKSNQIENPESVVGLKPSIPISKTPKLDSATKKVTEIKNPHKEPINLKINWNKWKVPCIIVGVFISIFVIFLLVLKPQNTIEYFYIKDGKAHLSRGCESGTVYVPATAIFSSNNIGFCSSCISNNKMRQIEDSLAYYKFKSSQYTYTKNIKVVYDKIRRDYTDVGDNASEFSKLLLKINNRETLLDINRTEGYGNWGKSLAEFESFLYGGYELFMLDGEVKYIPVEESVKFKKLCHNAYPYNLELNPEDCGK